MFRNRPFILIQVLIAAASLSAGAGLESKDKTKIMRSPDVVYVGTPYDLVSKMLQMAQVKKGDRVYDLGCGDARILILAAQKYGIHGMGFDIDPERVQASRENVARNDVENLVKIEQADIFTLDLSKADVIPIYLLPEMNKRLIPQLDKMKPGSRIVCHDYDLEGIVADKKIHVISNEDNADHTLSLYTTPLKRK
jgi:ribosomal protein L11 methylase PrmA